jgi:hypothetical protein
LRRPSTLIVPMGGSSNQRVLERRCQLWPPSTPTRLRRSPRLLVTTGRPADAEVVVTGMQRELHGPSIYDLARSYGIKVVA